MRYYSTKPFKFLRGGNQAFRDIRDIRVPLSVLPSFYTKCTQTKYLIDGVDVDNGLMEQKMWIFVSFLGIPHKSENEIFAERDHEKSFSTFISQYFSTGPVLNEN